MFVLTTEGINFFQAPDRDWEGTDTSELEDLNGVKLFEELLAAGRAGGGFVEYQWDNPAVEGDEEDGSPKLALRGSGHRRRGSDAPWIGDLPRRVRPVARRA